MLLDDAAGIPPFDNLSRYAKMGVDLYCFQRRERFAWARNVPASC